MGILKDITLKISLLFWFSICECESTCVKVGTFLSLYVQFLLNLTSLHLFEKVGTLKLRQKLQGDVLFVILPNHRTSWGEKFRIFSLLSLYLIKKKIIYIYENFILWLFTFSIFTCSFKSYFYFFIFCTSLTSCYWSWLYVSNSFLPILLWAHFIILLPPRSHHNCSYPVWPPCCWIQETLLSPWKHLI